MTVGRMYRCLEKLNNEERTLPLRFLSPIDGKEYLITIASNGEEVTANELLIIIPLFGRLECKDEVYVNVKDNVAKMMFEGLDDVRFKIRKIDVWESRVVLRGAVI